MIVQKIEAWVCDIPLSKPIDLGKVVVTQRSYLAVRLHTDDGRIADCVTQSRGSPLDVVVMEVIAPRLLGKDARDLAALRLGLERELSVLETHGAIGRAWSAVEICLQGLRAQACEWPLWRLLGGSPRPVPVLMVEGYAIRGEPEAGFIDRLVARVDEGFRMLKLEVGHYTEDAALLKDLEQFRIRAGDAPKVVLDMAWGWTESKSKLPTLSALEGMGIAWIEDPYLSHNVRQYQVLRAATNLPVGAGDETSRCENIYALLEANAVDVIRLDATTMGGIEAVRSLTSEAARRGVRVSHHVHPEIHEHLVFGLGIADHVEMFPTDRYFDAVHDLIATPTYGRVRDGTLSPSETPGTGLTLDLQKLSRFVRRHSSTDAA